jgi:hypothetical protein
VVVSPRRKLSSTKDPPVRFPLEVGDSLGPFPLVKVLKSL